MSFRPDPKRIILGTREQVIDPEALIEYCLKRGIDLIQTPGDHFFHGRGKRIGDLVGQGLEDLADQPTGRKLRFAASASVSVAKRPADRCPRLERKLIDHVLQLGELGLVVAVVDRHRVPHTDEPVGLETSQPPHHSSSSIPVGTSAEHMGQVTLGTIPTMKVKSHSGHWILGMG